MLIKLYSCNCKFKEIPNEVDNEVKGYSLVEECNVCKTKREEENARKLAEEQIRRKEELLLSQRKESIKQKLLALGLTQEEIEALLK